MTFFLQIQSTIDIISLVQNLGFPVAVALICMFFIWQALKYVRTKLDEKDNVITGMIEHAKKTQDEIVKTQNSIVITQEQIVDSQKSFNQSFTNWTMTQKGK